MFAAPPEDCELPERTREELGIPMEGPLKPFTGCYNVILFLWWLLEAVRLICPPDARVIVLMSLLLMPVAPPFFTFLISFLPDDIVWPSGMSEWSADSCVYGLKTIWFGLFTILAIALSWLLAVTRPTFLLWGLGAELLKSTPNSPSRAKFITACAVLGFWFEVFWPTNFFSFYRSFCFLSCFFWRYFINI